MLTIGSEYKVQDAWHPWWISPILGTPEVVVPGSWFSI
jgi:hypothetical protein